MTDKCPYCGFENPDACSFCGNCAENTLEGYNTKAAKLQRVQKYHQIKLDMKGKSVGCSCFLLVILLIFGILLFVFLQVDEKIDSNPSVQSTENVKTEVKLIKEINTESYVYNTGFTTDEFGNLKYHIFTQKSLITIRMINGKFDNFLEQHPINYEVQAGISSENEIFYINTDNCVIDSTKYTYDALLKDLVVKFSADSVVVNMKYVLFFCKNQYLIIAKRDEYENKIKYIDFKPQTVLSIVTSAFYDKDNEVLYITDGVKIYKYAISSLDSIYEEITIPYPKFENKSILPANETIWAISKHDDKFLFAASEKKSNTMKIYELSPAMQDKLFED